MRELQTFKCAPLYKFLKPIFYSQGNRKSIDNPNLISIYIKPACVAAWFCGDGSKADFTKNSGKGLTFHSQGFTDQENKILAECLRQNLNIDCSSVLDDPTKQQYRLDVSGTSYEAFVKTVGPLIHPTFHHRRASPYGACQCLVVEPRILGLVP